MDKKNEKLGWEKELDELLFKVAKAFKARSSSKLKKIEKKITNSLLVFLDKQTLELSLLTYVLHKILSKPRFFVRENKDRIKSIENLLEELAKAKGKKRKEKIREIEAVIISLERKDPRYVFDLFTKARVKVAATLYAKGLSLGKVSSFTGIPKEEILSYAGKTMMFDRLKEEKSMEKRVALAKKILLS